MFFSKKGGVHRNVQEFSKLTLFLNFDFFLLQEIPLHAAHISWTRPSKLPNDALKPQTVTLNPQTFDQTLLSVFVRMIVSFYLFYETTW